MARFKRRAAKRSSPFFRKARRSVSKSGSNANLMTIAMTSAAYGFGRPYLEKAIAPITSKIPLGGYADEVVLGVAGYFAAKGKFGNNKLIKSLGTSVLVIEAARIGSSVGTSAIGSSSSSNVSAYDY